MFGRLTPQPPSSGSSEYRVKRSVPLRRWRPCWLLPPPTGNSARNHKRSILRQDLATACGSAFPT